MKRFQPIRLIEIELSDVLPSLPPSVEGGRRYASALALVRLHGDPLGLVELSLDDAPVSPKQYAGGIWSAVGEEIVAHLRMDGLEEIDGIGVGGLSTSEKARCLRERDKLLARAPFITVVISTRDRTDVLPRCLASLRALDYPSYEVVVIDNAPSTDATARLVSRDFGHVPWLRYFREDQPGLSVARNRGVAEARGELIAFTDDDVVVDKYWLTGLARGFLQESHVGCVTGLVMPMELETQSQVWFEEFGGFGKGCRGRIFDNANNRPHNPIFPYAAGQFGSGNNMAFRAEALREIGGFDSALGAGTPTRGGEDLASFVAVIRKGYALVYEPAAIVHHQHRRDYASLRRHIYDCGIGLTAYLTKCLLDNPASSLDLLAKAPAGIKYALSSSSLKNRKKRPNYPSELSKIELQGMLRGPTTYWRARHSNVARWPPMPHVGASKPCAVDGPRDSLAENDLLNG